MSATKASAKKKSSKGPAPRDGGGGSCDGEAGKGDKKKPPKTIPKFSSASRGKRREWLKRGMCFPEVRDPFEVLEHGSRIDSKRGKMVCSLLQSLPLESEEGGRKMRPELRPDEACPQMRGLCGTVCESSGADRKIRGDITWGRRPDTEHSVVASLHVRGNTSYKHPESELEHIFTLAAELHWNGPVEASKQLFTVFLTEAQKVFTEPYRRIDSAKDYPPPNTVRNIRLDQGMKIRQVLFLSNKILGAKLQTAEGRQLKECLLRELFDIPARQQQWKDDQLEAKRGYPRKEFKRVMGAAPSTQLMQLKSVCLYELLQHLLRDGRQDEVKELLGEGATFLKKGDLFLVWMEATKSLDTDRENECKMMAGIRRECLTHEALPLHVTLELEMAGGSWEILELMVKQVRLKPFSFDLRLACLNRLCQSYLFQQEREQGREWLPWAADRINELLPDLYRMPVKDLRALSQFIALMPRRRLLSVGPKGTKQLRRDAARFTCGPHLGTTRAKVLLTTAAELETLMNLLEHSPLDHLLWEMLAALLADTERQQETREAILKVLKSPSTCDFWQRHFFVIPLPSVLHESFGLNELRTLVLFSAYFPQGAMHMEAFLGAVQEASSARKSDTARVPHCLPWPESVVKLARVCLPDLPPEVFANATWRALDFSAPGGIDHARVREAYAKIFL